MIINRIGAEFEYEGTTYVIGAPIVGTPESEYEGLYGTITEIRVGEDKETENETPDLYCSFEVPVLPCEVKAGRGFSELYSQKRPLTTSFWILSSWLHLWWSRLTIWKSAASIQEFIFFGRLGGRWRTGELFRSLYRF